MAGDWIETGEKLGGWIVALTGFALAVARYGVNLFRDWRAIRDFRDQWGDAPAQEIRKVVDVLRHSASTGEMRHRLAERHLQIGIYFCGTDGKCIWVNSYLGELWGIDRASCLDYGWLSVIDQSDRERVHRLWTNCVQTGIPYETKYTIINAQTKQPHNIYTQAFPIVRDGKIECYVGQVFEKDK